MKEGIGSLLGDPAFEAKLVRAIAEHFTMFLAKGFTVKVNGVSVSPARIEVLLPSGDLCTPYYAEDQIGGTRFSVLVGVNARIFRLQDDDDEDPADLRGSTMPEAGWSIFCNERAVLVGDKSRLTGWGNLFATFHPQFSILTGMVHFQASDSNDLPITTTKRALDTSSKAWLVAARLMGDGMKAFISYTTAWKNVGRKAQQPFFEGATPADVVEAAAALEGRARQLPRNRRRAAPNRRVYNPKKDGHLPRPIGKKSNLTRIKFARPAPEVEFLASRLLGHSESPKPDQVGEACFERTLEQEDWDGAG